MTTNYHCSVLEIGGTGILIDGASGSGKTSLVFGLVERSEVNGYEAHFVCDDQALLRQDGESLIAEAPSTIAGKIELRGFGILDISHKPSAAIDVVFRLVKEDEVERMPSPEIVQLQSVTLPLVKIPMQHEARSARIVMAWLDEYWRKAAT